MKNKLREYRKQSGETQVKLAKVFGINGPMLSDFERGVRVPYPKVKRLASEFFGVEEAELFPEDVEDGR